MKQTFIFLFAVVVSIMMALSAHGSLIVAEPVPGELVVLDTDTNLMWLQDMNYSAASGYDADGLMSWPDAMAWAENLVYGGYSDWRLPSALNSDGTEPSTLPGSDDWRDTELGHLFFDALGNDNILGWVNIGPFIATNYMKDYYWSNTEISGAGDMAWNWETWDGYFLTGSTIHSNMGAWAVRDHVPLIPEPASWILLGSGLIVLGIPKRWCGLNGVLSKPLGILSARKSNE